MREVGLISVKEIGSIPYKLYLLMSDLAALTSLRVSFGLHQIT